MSSILIIDDEAGVRASLGGVLRDEGYTVDAVDSGEACLEQVTRQSYDVLLLDVWLPGLDGLATLERLRERRLDSQVIMISGHGNVESAVRATKLGAFDFLEKPLSTDKVLITVQNALELARVRRERDELYERAAVDFAMIGAGPRMKAIFEKIRKTAPTQGRVLITGENGTGKELVAREFHQDSKRAHGAFVKVNCAAIPSELIESELFGHEKGAFTGATQARRGKFELAHEGTIFLDEIGDMAPGAQAKVLRVLQEGELERVGGHETISVDVRVVSATNKNLQEEIKGGRFREDLFYRLNVVPLELPPLREHKEDIPALVEHFVKVACEKNDMRPKSLEQAGVSLLMQYDWPGNVRELRNAIERLVILSDGNVVREGDVREVLPGAKPVRARYAQGVALRDLMSSAEREIILEALEAHAHHVSNTAKALGVERSHLYKKMRALGIDPRGGEEAAGEDETSD
jgi:DNA-binding NtrC family response regulator